jgi:hypothetical protein
MRAGCEGWVTAQTAGASQLQPQGDGGASFLSATAFGCSGAASSAVASFSSFSNSCRQDSRQCVLERPEMHCNIGYNDGWLSAPCMRILAQVCRPAAHCTRRRGADGLQAGRFRAAPLLAAGSGPAQARTFAADWKFFTVLPRPLPSSGSLLGPAGQHVVHTHRLSSGGGGGGAASGGMSAAGSQAQAGWGVLTEDQRHHACDDGHLWHAQAKQAHDRHSPRCRPRGCPQGRPRDAAACKCAAARGGAQSGPLHGGHRPALNAGGSHCRCCPKE